MTNLRMSPNVTAEIICEVEKNPLQYDFTLVDYKDMQQNNLVWKEIAKKVGVKSGELIAWKWKNLRDSYSKYKKQIQSPPHDERGHKSLVNWRWAKMMTFLDPYMRKPREFRENTGNSPHSLANDFRLSGEPEAFEVIDSKPSENFKVTGSASKLRKSFRVSPEPESSNQVICSTISSSKVETDNKRKRKFLEAIDEVTIEPFPQERSSFDKLDMTDYLFLNYSETFKRLGRKRQTLLKLKMAKMFAEAELEELDSDPIKFKIPNDDSD